MRRALVTTNGAALPRVLVADDQQAVLGALGLLLRNQGYEVHAATTPAEVAKAVAEREFDVVLLDMNYARDTTSGREGIDLLTRLHAVHPHLPVVVMTAWGSVEGAVSAMRSGARDYVEKPWDNERLLATLQTQVELSRALRRAERLEAVAERFLGAGTPTLIVASHAMKRPLEIMERVAPSDASVLITGEHGTGKDVVARWIHSASRRRHRPLVAVNAGGISEGIFESELFGHVKGAFTDAKTDRVGYFEMADGGTLFLDEIGNMPLGLQAKLLRVLQTGEFQRVGSTRTIRADVRIITATNIDIGAEIQAGRFREDLLYRLNTVRIHLPSLSRRREDIPLLAMHFLREKAARYDARVTAFSPAAMQAMLSHPWPGNVRELEHTIERAVILSRGTEVGVEDLQLGHPAGADSDGREAGDDLELEAMERTMVRRAMDRHDGNISEAAATLGISRAALYRRLRRFGL